MASIFTRIVNGEIPAYKVYENDNFLAFLDIFPLKKGHTLVIPKREVDYIFDMSESETKELHLFAQKVAKAVHKAFPCKKVAMIVLGLEVPHAHVHLIPMDKESEVHFSNQKLSLSQEEFQTIAEKIRLYI